MLNLRLSLVSVIGVKSIFFRVKKYTLQTNAIQRNQVLVKGYIVINKLDAALSLHQNVLRVRGQRQELIAANIANADTPNYKARDLDFGAVMKNAMSGVAQEGFNTSKTSTQHLDGAPSKVALTGGALFRPVMQGSVDGNTVDMDVERNQFADNAIRYEASLIMINGQLKSMLSAIQSQ